MSVDERVERQAAKMPITLLEQTCLTGPSVGSLQVNFCKYQQNAAFGRTAVFLKNMNKLNTTV